MARSLPQLLNNTSKNTSIELWNKKYKAPYVIVQFILSCTKNKFSGENINTKYDI